MTKLTFKEYSHLMNKVAYWLIANNKKIKTRDVYNVGGKGVKYATMKKNILANKGSSNNKYGRRFTEDAIKDNKSYDLFPNYVSHVDGTKYFIDTYTDMAKRVIAFKKANGRNPSYVSVKKTTSTSTSTDKVLKAFEDAFGKVTDFDSALKKIEGRGYKYYYNSVYNTAQTLKRIKNGQGVNCTDSSQLMYRIALALGYTVQFIHVQCSTGGHIRLRLKHKKNTGGEWIYRDPACVLSDNGKGIRCNWCMDGKIIAYNPSWIMSDVMA